VSHAPIMRCRAMQLRSAVRRGRRRDVQRSAPKLHRSDAACAARSCRHRPAREPKTRKPRCKSTGALDDLQLSDFQRSGRPDSNRRRPAWEAGILPTELRPPDYRTSHLLPNDESHRSGLNRRPLDYESSALPLSYCGVNPLRGNHCCLPHALERTRTATPRGTTPSRWRVYQFHHQGVLPCGALLFQGATYTNGADGARTRDLSSDSRVL
jgi:hypothetical protein